LRLCAEKRAVTTDITMTTAWPQQGDETAWSGTSHPARALRARWDLQGRVRVASSRPRRL